MYNTEDRQLVEINATVIIYLNKMRANSIIRVGMHALSWIHPQIPGCEFLALD